MQAEFLEDDRKYFLMKNMILLTLKRQLFSSYEEINDFFLWTDD